MIWITPLLAVTSAVVTVASLILTVPSVTLNEASSPFSIVTVSPSVTALEATFPLRTWYVKISARVAFSSSVSNVDKSIPASWKAVSVGAKTVNGPSPCKTETRLACASAATSAS